MRRGNRRGFISARVSGIAFFAGSEKFAVESIPEHVAIIARVFLVELHPNAVPIENEVFLCFVEIDCTSTSMYPPPGGVPPFGREIWSQTRSP